MNRKEKLGTKREKRQRKRVIKRWRQTIKELVTERERNLKREK
jgi:hypothetical protein